MYGTTGTYLVLYVHAASQAPWFLGRDEAVWGETMAGVNNFVSEVKQGGEDKRFREIGIDKLLVANRKQCNSR